MSRRFPIGATIIVVAACLVMLGLGVWQLARAEEKEELIATAIAAQQMREEAAWPDTEEQVEEALYRRSSLTCSRVAAYGAVAGTRQDGAKGWAQRATCIDNSGREFIADIGWSRAPQQPDWDGGPLLGVIAPGPRLVADPPVVGLEPLALPDPRELPNNHVAYAVQWFIFAIVAFVIYLISLRRRNRSD